MLSVHDVASCFAAERLDDAVASEGAAEAYQDGEISAPTADVASTNTSHATAQASQLQADAVAAMVVDIDFFLAYSDVVWRLVTQCLSSSQHASQRRCTTVGLR